MALVKVICWAIIFITIIEIFLKNLFVSTARLSKYVFQMVGFLTTFARAQIIFYKISEEDCLFLSKKK